VDKNVLIPRDDTCAVASLAIDKALILQSDPRILDLCTGSGCIGLAVASRVKDARVTLADISKDALAVAKKNKLEVFVIEFTKKSDWIAVMNAYCKHRGYHAMQVKKANYSKE
jgi:HemK-like putative methylase